ncbi:MAG: alginate export family protein [Candidatus Omnitrophica bacterium]|nr:alginate export family protein [Candidatus Omnitrophota bacterium]
MNKRLILTLAFALALCFAFSAYAEVQNVKVSGDITVLGLVRNPFLTGGHIDDGTGVSTGQKTESAMASITRVRIDADLTDNVVATVRLLNERYWGREIDNNGGTNTKNSDIDLDLAYVTLKEFLYSPLSLAVGRQELHFGNDMILGDPDTNNQVTTASPFGATTWPRNMDLSARKSFDAVRATLDYNPLVIDLVASTIKNRTLNRDDNESLYGINANYALDKNTTLEGYFWQRRIGKKTDNTTTVIHNNKVDTTDVVGLRAVTKPIENLTYQLEAAYQFGTRVNTTLTTPGSVTGTTQTRSALGIETSLTYDFKKVKYTPSATALYAYFSGDKSSGTKRYTGWDAMYENQTFGNIANTLFNQTNIHLAGGVLTAKPMDDITLKGEYYAYWWDKRLGNTASAIASGETLAMTGKKFAGQELDLTLTYDYTEDVQFSLLGGYFKTGNSFDKQNRNTSGEVIGSMKVTF